MRLNKAEQDYLPSDKYIKTRTTANNYDAFAIYPETRNDYRPLPAAYLPRPQRHNTMAELDNSLTSFPISVPVRPIQCYFSSQSSHN